MNRMLKESWVGLPKECLSRASDTVVEEYQRKMGWQTPLFVVTGNGSPTIRLSSLLPGQEECNRAHNSLMARQTERHALCRVTLTT